MLAFISRVLPKEPWAATVFRQTMVPQPLTTPRSTSNQPFTQTGAVFATKLLASNIRVMEMLLPIVREVPPSLLQDYKDDLDELPFYKFRAGTNNESRRIVMVTSKNASRKAVEMIRSELKQSPWACTETGAAEYQFLGFDIESKPIFHKGGKQAVAMVQLATRSTAYLFRTKFSGMGEASRGKGAWTPELRSLLSDPNIIKIGVGIDGDVRLLHDYYGPNCCRQDSFLDLERLIRTKWTLPPRRLGLRGLAAFLLRQRLTKAQRMKNWEIPKITDAMTEYAAADAFVSLDLLNAIIPESKFSMPEDVAEANRFNYTLTLTMPRTKVETFVHSLRSRLGQDAKNEGGNAKLKKAKGTKSEINRFNYTLTLTMPRAKVEKFIHSLRSRLGQDAKNEGGYAKLKKEEG